jgi:hypothetical protein
MYFLFFYFVGKIVFRRPKLLTKRDMEKNLSAINCVHFRLRKVSGEKVAETDWGLWWGVFVKTYPIKMKTDIGNSLQNSPISNFTENSSVSCLVKDRTDLANFGRSAGFWSRPEVLQSHVKICEKQSQNSAPPDEATELQTLYFYYYYYYWLEFAFQWEAVLSRIQEIKGSNSASKPANLSGVKRGWNPWLRGEMSASDCPSHIMAIRKNRC